MSDRQKAISTRPSRTRKPMIWISAPTELEHQEQRAKATRGRSLDSLHLRSVERTVVPYSSHSSLWNYFNSLMASFNLSRVSAQLDHYSVGSFSQHLRSWFIVHVARWLGFGLGAPGSNFHPLASWLLMMMAHMSHQAHNLVIGELWPPLRRVGRDIFDTGSAKDG